MSDRITIADYLFSKLHQLGIRSIFGVPGDYNLKLLDHVEPSGLRWVGNCNELNAAYAADGYARINGLAALITTFGVGELSAMNGVAGAYAEKVPVIHIVGTPSRVLQETRALMHHTFVDGNYRQFAMMYSNITVGQENLLDPRTVSMQIDTVLERALLHSRPVYIEVPDDMVNIKIERPRSKVPRHIPATISDNESQAVKLILDRMYSTQRPVILVDGESRPCGILDLLNALSEMTGWPTWTTTFGKGLLDESLKNVHGVYMAGYGDKRHKAYFENADLVLYLGPHISDTNSQGFTTLPRDEDTVAFFQSLVKIGNMVIRDISCRTLVDQILQRLDKSRLVSLEIPRATHEGLEDLDPKGRITQSHFYRFVNPIIQQGDVVLTETGTAAHGGRGFQLPSKVRMLTAVTWLSIGYMLPATLGAALAQREKVERNHEAEDPSALLFIGDGSVQMSVQELSTIISQKLNVICFVINNDGYTIERAIHGRNQKYNDVASWRYTQALNFFGDGSDHASESTYTARNWGELRSVMSTIRNGEGLRIVEVFMDREDCSGILSDLLKRQIESEKPE